jgi:hypothetical protein
VVYFTPKIIKMGGGNPPMQISGSGALRVYKKLPPPSRFAGVLLLAKEEKYSLKE